MKLNPRERRLNIRTLMRARCNVVMLANQGGENYGRTVRQILNEGLMLCRKIGAGSAHDTRKTLDLICIKVKDGRYQEAVEWLDRGLLLRGVDRDWMSASARAVIKPGRTGISGP